MMASKEERMQFYQGSDSGPEGASEMAMWAQHRVEVPEEAYKYQ